MKRRAFIEFIGTAAAASSLPLALAVPASYAARGARPMLQDLHDNWREHLPEGFDAPQADDPLRLDKDAWKARLGDGLAFDVLRREGTERPFTSPLNDEKRDGVFVCAGCDLPVFTAPMKFDSGTGWPSFFTSIPGAFETKRDFKLILPRTEYHCARCGGHHGHVFNDGPEPTGERWCNNGVALKFLPRD
jgi:peptide-methionine (R)-S-oxide reductase